MPTNVETEKTATQPKTKRTTRRRRVSVTQVKSQASAPRRTPVPLESNWQGMSAIVCALLSVYFLLVPGLDFLLGLLAIIFGVLGLKTVQRLPSIVAIVTGTINCFLAFGVSVLGVLVLAVAAGASDDIEEMVDSYQRPSRSSQEVYEFQINTDEEVKSNRNKTRTNRRSEQNNLEQELTVPSASGWNNTSGTVPLTAPQSVDDFPEFITIDSFGRVVPVDPQQAQQW